MYICVCYASEINFYLRNASYISLVFVRENAAKTDTQAHTHTHSHKLKDGQRALKSYYVSNNMNNSHWPVAYKSVYFCFLLINLVVLLLLLLLSIVISRYA